MIVIVFSSQRCKMSFYYNTKVQQIFDINKFIFMSIEDFERFIKEIKDKICKCLDIKECKIFVSTNYNKQTSEIVANFIYDIDKEFGITFRIASDDGKCISSFNLQQLPGCCGVCVSNMNNIYAPFNGKGLNSILNQFRKDIARIADYTVLLCTDLHDNIPQKKTLIRNGWKDIYQFTNIRTDNLIDISVVNLQE